MDELNKQKILAELKTGKYSLNGLEDYLKIPHDTLTKFKNGTQDLPIKHIEKLIKHLKLSKNG